MHYINKHKEDHDHSPTGNPHVDPRLSHMNEDDKCQKRILSWYLSKRTDELRPINSKSQVWNGNGLQLATTLN